MTFNRKKFPNRDPEREAEKIKKRFSTVTSRYERHVLFSRLKQQGLRYLLFAALGILAFLAIIHALGFRW